MNTKDYGWSEAAPRSCCYIGPKIKTLVDVHKPRSVLDLGCGNGELLKILSAPERTVVGVEHDQGGCEISRRNSPGALVFNLGVQDDPAPVLASQPDKFDVVVSTEVIEHLYSPALLPRFAARVLKPGGILIVSTPYHGYLKNLALSVADKWDDHHTPFWDGGHIKFWSRRTLSQLLRREGFELLAFHGVGRLPFLWKSMILIGRLSA